MARVGQSTGGIEQSPRYRRKVERKRRAEEASWKAQNGDVTSYVDRELAESVRRAAQAKNR